MVCMASSWVSKRENCCARRVGGRIGREPARNAGGVDRRPHQRGASDEHHAIRVALLRLAHLSLQKFFFAVALFKKFNAKSMQSPKSLEV